MLMTRDVAERSIKDKTLLRGHFPQAEVRAATTGPIKATINTDDEDRYETIVDPMGGNIDNYLANPILQWSHGQDMAVGTWPVGRVLSVTKSQRTLDVELEFDVNGSLHGGPCKIGAELDRLYREGWCRGFSIGFIPLSFAVEMVDGRELVRFTSWELVELSACSVPANPKALAKAIRTGELSLETKELREMCQEKPRFAAMRVMGNIGSCDKATEARAFAEQESRKEGKRAALLCRSKFQVGEHPIYQLDGIADARQAAVAWELPAKDEPAELFLREADKLFTRLSVSQLISQLKGLTENKSAKESFFVFAMDEVEAKAVEQADGSAATLPQGLAVGVSEEHAKQLAEQKADEEAQAERIANMAMQKFREMQAKEEAEMAERIAIMTAKACEQSRPQERAGAEFSKTNVAAIEASADQIDALVQQLSDTSRSLRDMVARAKKSPPIESSEADEQRSVSGPPRASVGTPKPATISRSVFLDVGRDVVREALQRGIQEATQDVIKRGQRSFED